MWGKWEKKPEKASNNLSFGMRYSYKQKLLEPHYSKKKMCIVLESRCTPQHSLRAQKAV